MSYSSAVLADSPLAFWRFSETSGATIADASGNGHGTTLSGTYTRNAASLTTDADAALTLAAAGVAVIPYGAWMHASGYSIEFLVKMTSTATRAVLDRDQSSGRAWQLYITGGQVAFVKTGGGVDSIVSGTGNTVHNGAAHHVVLTHGGGFVRVYIDGTERAWKAMTDLPSVASPMAIGAQWGGGGGATPGSNMFDGTLDEIAYYGTVLTPTQVSTHYDAARGIFTATTSTAATLPALTSAAAGDVTIPAATAATLPSLSATVAAKSTATAVVGAALPHLSSSVAATADDTVPGTVAATLPALSAATAVTLPAVGPIDATLPALSAAVTVAVTPPAGSDRIVATLPALSSSVVVDSGLSLEPWTSGAHGDALLVLDCPPGVLEVTYAATVAPAAIVEVPLAFQSHQSAIVGGNTHGMTSVPLGVPHVWVDGVDVTYFRGVPVKLAGWRDEAPFGWTDTTLTFPQVFHFEEPGTGDLAWMRPDAPVEIAIVREDGSRLHRFTGQLTSDDPGTGRGRTECVWGVEGLLWQAAHAHHEVPARLDPTDIGTLIPGELNGTPSRRFSPIAKVATGIPERKRGSHGQNRWDYVTDLLSVAVREDGKQWTIEPTGPRSFRLALKNTTTVDWTVTAGAPGVELDLSKDHHERIDAVYGRGVGPDGYAWANVFFPDLLPYDPPDYPYADPDRNVLLGDEDSDTLTGQAITLWQRRIRDLGYTSLAVDGVFGAADRAAVYWIQRKRGIQVDGFMGPQTWAATWNVGTIGGDLSTVRLPLAVRPEVERYLYGANGATVGKNPEYDPSIIRHEVDVDFGAGVTKAQGREMAQRILERGTDPGIAGTIRLTTCPWEGSRWEINAGDNVKLKGYRGGDVLARIVAVDADPEALTVTLTIDSEFRDAMAVVQVLERNRESKADPARRPGNPNKRSRLDQDMVTPFEGESPAGRLPRMALFGGLWTVWPVPVSEIGDVAKLRFWTEGPTSKFCVAMFGKPITANQIDAFVPAPLTNSTPWETHEETLLNKFGWIDTWGKDGQAAGYSPGQEGESALTGKLTDDAGFPFVSQKSPWVWVAMWSPVATFIEGRIYPSPVQ